MRSVALAMDCSHRLLIQIIKLVGGAAVLANFFKIGRSTVSMWSNQTNHRPYVYSIILAYYFCIDLSKLEPDEIRANKIILKWRLAHGKDLERINWKKAMLDPPLIKAEITLAQKAIKDRTLEQIVELLGGAKALAIFLKVSGSTVRMWLSHKNEKMSYAVCIILCDAFNLPLCVLAPDEVCANEILERWRLKGPVSEVQVSGAYLLNRTLAYLKDDLSERLIVDGHYCLITGWTHLQKRVQSGQKTVLVIALELKALAMSTRILEDFSPCFSMNERLAIALCLCEQWQILTKEATLEQAEHSTLAQNWAQHTCMDGYLSKEEKIAQIVGISSKHALVEAIKNYKEGSVSG